jgi:ketosteroid isomerase-like protein
MVISRISVLVVIGAVLVQLGGLAQNSAESAAQEVRRLEDELTKALLERDASALDRLWHDDLLFIARNGSQSTKGERIAGQGASRQQPGETNVNDDVAVRIIGDTAITTVGSTWTFPSDSGLIAGRYRALHVWVRSAGRWQLLAAQVAMLPQ